MTGHTLVYVEDDGTWVLALDLDGNGSHIALTVEAGELVDIGLAFEAAVVHGHARIHVDRAYIDINTDPDVCSLHFDLGTLNVLAVIPHPRLAELTRAITQAVGQ